VSRRKVPWMAVRVAGATAVIAAVSAFTPPGWLASFGASIVIPAAFWSAAGFIAYYTLLAPWFRNPVGRMIVFLDFAVMCALFGDILQSEFGVRLTAVVQVRLYAGALLIIPAVVLSRAWLLGRLHGWKPRLPWRHPRREDRDG
jgi:hypothetical protein